MPAAVARISTPERLARAGAPPTRSGPEGSSRNGTRLGRCPASHLLPRHSVPLRGRRSKVKRHLVGHAACRSRAGNLYRRPSALPPCLRTHRFGHAPLTPGEPLAETASAPYRVLARKYRPLTFAD